MTEADARVPRWRKSSWHLLLSAEACGLVLVPILLVWYPRPLFAAAGSGKLAVALAIVAAALGPLAGFLLRRAGRPLDKRGLKRVAGLQLLALAGCALALYLQRPVYLVFTLDRFDLVLARDLDPRDLAKAKLPEFRHRPLDGPRYVAAVPPADPAEVQRILDQTLAGGKDLQRYPEYYVAYPAEARHALARAQPLDLLIRRDPERVGRYLESAGRSSDALRFLPLRAPGRDGVVLLDAVSGLPQGVLMIEPW